MKTKTTKIVFACNSNSCRSQMAEGWARQYLIENNLMDQPVIVTSVALDAESIKNELREKKGTNKQCDNEICCGDICETVTHRKSVKAKAVAAMKNLGVEMKFAVPKSWNELLPVIMSSRSQQEADDLMIKQLTARAPNTEDIFERESFNSAVDIDIDRLIVLCSCGDEMKYALGNISHFVEEWNVDAPTAMSKAGEGDIAYTRVSLEIKDKVDRLMSDIAMPLP